MTFILEMKARIQQGISGKEKYALPNPIEVEPSELLSWIDEFSLDAGFQSLLESLEDGTYDLQVTGFIASDQGRFELTFNARSADDSGQGFLSAVGIDVGGLQLGDLVDITEIGLSLSSPAEDAGGASP